MPCRNENNNDEQIITTNSHLMQYLPYICNNVGLFKTTKLGTVQ